MSKRLTFRQVNNKKLIKSHLTDESLGWLKSYNHINFTLTNITIEHYFSANERNWDCLIDLRDDIQNSIESSHPELNVFKSNALERRVLTGLIELESLREFFYFTKPAEDSGDSEYIADRAEGVAMVTISPRTNNTDFKDIEANLGIDTRKSKAFSQDSYPGLLLAGDSIYGNETFTIDFGFPPQLFDKFIAAIEASKSRNLQISASIESFTDEANMALRGHFDPKELIIHGICAKAALLNVKIERKMTEIHHAAAPDPEEIEIDENHDLQNLSPHPVQATSSHNNVKSLKAIAMPLWGIFILLAINSMFK